MSLALSVPINMTNPVWLGEGKSGKWTDFREAKIACDLAITAEFSPLQADNGVFAETHQAVIDKYRGDVLGVVSNNYCIIQNEVAFEPIRQLVENNGATIIAGGVTRLGLHFMVAELQHLDVRGDPFVLDVIATNSFNGSYSMTLAIVPRRVVCNNQFRGILASKNADAIYRINHTKHADAQLMRLSSHITVTTEALLIAHEFSDYSERLIDQPMKETDAYSLVSNDLFKVNEKDISEKAREIRKQKAMDFMLYYYEATNNAVYMNTTFGLVNAYMAYLCHAPEKVEKRATNMFDGSFLNTGWLRNF